MTVSGSSTKIYKGYYYDVKGRVTKVVQNNLLGGYDVTNTVYAFTGQPATVGRIAIPQAASPHVRKSIPIAMTMQTV